MNSLLFLFVVVFVLALAASCALFVLRMLGTLDLPDTPPFPHRRRPFHQHIHRAGDSAAAQPDRRELAHKH